MTLFILAILRYRFLRLDDIRGDIVFHVALGTQDFKISRLLSLGSGECSGTRPVASWNAGFRHTPLRQYIRIAWPSILDPVRQIRGGNDV